MATTRQPEVRARRVQPRSAVFEEEDKVMLAIEMPGMARADVSISVEADELRVHGAHHHESENDLRYIIRERRPEDYYQVFTLDDSIDRDRIEAKMQKGVLTITLEKKESSKPRQITVREIT